jgi:hypothetical protein
MTARHEGQTDRVCSGAATMVGSDPRPASPGGEVIQTRFEFKYSTHQIALSGAVDDLQLQAIPVVQEERVVARRVVVLTRVALDLRVLLAQP